MIINSIRRLLVFSFLAVVISFTSIFTSTVQAQGLIKTWNPPNTPSPISIAKIKDTSGNVKGSFECIILNEKKGLATVTMHLRPENYPNVKLLGQDKKTIEQAIDPRYYKNDVLYRIIVWKNLGDFNNKVTQNALGTETATNRYVITEPYLVEALWPVPKVTSQTIVQLVTYTRFQKVGLRNIQLKPIIDASSSFDPTVTCKGVKDNKNQITQVALSPETKKDAEKINDTASRASAILSGLGSFLGAAAIGLLQWISSFFRQSF